MSSAARLQGEAGDSKPTRPTIKTDEHQGHCASGATVAAAELDADAIVGHIEPEQSFIERYVEQPNVQVDDQARAISIESGAAHAGEATQPSYVTSSLELQREVQGSGGEDEGEAAQAQKALRRDRSVPAEVPPGCRRLRLRPRDACADVGTVPLSVLFWSCEASQRKIGRGRLPTSWRRRSTVCAMRTTSSR